MVSVADTFGVSQRGGSVASHIKISKETLYSSVTLDGKADLILGMEPETAELSVRPLGSGAFVSNPLTHVARGVYRVTLPAPSIESDFEYYAQAKRGDSSLVFPPTAPALNQTVVVSE